MSIRVFLVEDDPVIAIDLENSLAEAGFEIACTAASVRGALRALPTIECDVAVLDVNLRGESVEPVALALRDRRIPYLFATGYGSDAIPKEFADARVVPKPVDAAVLAREIMRLLNT
jgi:DNA-binding NarL/FixJ family response regulator